MANRPSLLKSSHQPKDADATKIAPILQVRRPRLKTLAQSYAVDK